MVDVQLDQIWNKEEESAETGGEPGGCQREGANVSDRFYSGSGILGSLIVQASRQGSEAFFMEDLTDSGRTETDTAVLEDFADLRRLSGFSFSTRRFGPLR